MSTNCLFNITSTGLAVLLDKMVDLNSLFVLYQYHQEKDVDIHNARIAAWRQTLVRKKLLTDQNVVTLTGLHLLQEVTNGRADEPIKISKATDPFEKWWSHAYPDTDHFEMDGRIFLGQQKKHFEKEKSRSLYWEIINEGQADHEDIYWATISLVENAKARSQVSGKSEITFIPNSKRFLELRCFTPFIEAGRKRRTVTQLQVKPYDFNI